MLQNKTRDLGDLTKTILGSLIEHINYEQDIFETIKFF